MFGTEWSFVITYIATKRSVRVGLEQVYIQAFMYVSLGRTSVHLMNLQIRVGRGGEETGKKKDKKFQTVKKASC